MSCKVQILVENLEDVVIVPIQVVSNRGGRKVCFVMTPQGPEERVVSTGSFNDTFVQVVEGLQQGEEVLLNPPLFSESTGAVGFQQQQPLPEKKPEQGQADTTEVQGRPGGSQTGRRAGGLERSQDMSAEKPQAGGESPGPTGPPQGRQFQMTDEVIDRMLAGMKKFNPEKAQELEKLRKDDPEKFKTELEGFMKSMRETMMRQGRNRMRQGQGDAEGGQSR